MHKDMLITLLIEQSIKLMGQVQILIGVLDGKVPPQIQQTPSPHEGLSNWNLCY